MSRISLLLLCVVGSLHLQAQDKRRILLSISGSRYTSGNMANEFYAVMCYEGCPPVNQRNRWAGSLEVLAGVDLNATSSVHAGFQLNTKAIHQKLVDLFEGGFFHVESRWRYRGATVLFRTSQDYKKVKLTLEAGPWLDVLVKADRQELFRNAGGSLLVRPGIQYGPLQFGVQALAAFTNYYKADFPSRDNYYPYSIGASVGWRW